MFAYYCIVKFRKAGMVVGKAKIHKPARLKEHKL